jgi:hypothetical protein
MRCSHKLNDVDPQAWLADVLARIAEHAANKLDDLLPWNWATERASYRGLGARRYRTASLTRGLRRRVTLKVPLTFG